MADVGSNIPSAFTELPMVVVGAGLRVSQAVPRLLPRMASSVGGGLEGLLEVRREQVRPSSLDRPVPSGELRQQPREVRHGIDAVQARGGDDREPVGEPEPQARAELSRAMDTLRERPLDLVRACVVGAALAEAEGDADGATRWRDRARAGADAMGLPAGSPLRRGT